MREASDSVQSLIREDRESHNLTVSQRVTGKEIETTKFQHFYKGIEVFGSMAFHHRSRGGAEVRDSLKRFDLNTQPTLSQQDAVALAKSVAGDRELLQEPELKIFPSELGDSAQLVYWVDLDANGPDGGREIILDAQTGQLIGNLSKHIELAPIQVYSAKNQGVEVMSSPNISRPRFTLDALVNTKSIKSQGCQVKDLATGKVSNLDAMACNRLGPGLCQVVVDSDPVVVNPQSCQRAYPAGTTTPDAASARAYQNSQTVTGYFLNRLGRNSYDGRGSAVVSVAHGGQGYDNAHWDTQKSQMVYGDGDGKTFGDFTLALDVAGHEMTHGVTSASAKLLNMGESGALNEAFSDFFGVMVSGATDWSIGKKLFLNQASAKGVRDLANPHNLTFRGGKPYPDKYSEKFPTTGACDGSNDNCYVHVNATIPGHASYLVFKAIGQAKAEKLYFTVLTQAIGPRDDIRSVANVTKTTCTKLFDSATCSQVSGAFAQVGL